MTLPQMNEAVCPGVGYLYR